MRFASLAIMYFPVRIVVVVVVVEVVVVIIVVVVVVVKEKVQCANATGSIKL